MMARLVVLLGKETRESMIRQCMQTVRGLQGKNSKKEEKGTSISFLAHKTSLDCE